MPILRVILADFNEMTLVIWSTLMVYLLQVRLFITTLLNDHYGASISSTLKMMNE